MRKKFSILRTRRAEGEHPGLLLSRYLSTSDGGSDNPEERIDLLNAALTASRAASLVEIYGRAFERWQKGLEAKQAVATPPHARLIVGLGQKGVLEAGLRLHHTYGTPLVPGSALKGVAAHYAHEIWGKENARYLRDTGDFHRLLFGTTEEGGCIRFEDAWAVPNAFKLHRDVITPHHQAWQTNPAVAPTDFDDPVPVPYLTVSGRFQLGLSWQGPASDQGPKWVRRAMKLLMEALAEWGVGGKTSSGYGRLIILSPGPVAQRKHGVPTKVTIIRPRANVGFDVQEEGRPQGTLTVGTPPAGTDTSPGKIVDVLVHVDDPRHPQYRWP